MSPKQGSAPRRPDSKLRNDLGLVLFLKSKAGSISASPADTKHTVHNKPSIMAEFVHRRENSCEKLSVELENPITHGLPNTHQ